MSFLFGGGSKQAAPASVQTVSQTSEFPTEVKPFITDILEKSQAQQEGRNFELFEGPRIAPFSQEEEAAFTGVQGIQQAGLGAYPGLASSAFYAQQAQDAAEQGLKEFNVTDAQRLTNPFQQQVIDIEKDEAIRQFEGTTLPQIGAQAAGAGSFGGSRQAILEAEAQRNLQQQLGDIQARGLRDSYDKAASQFEMERARQSQGAGQFGGFAQQFPAQALRELGALQSVGEQRKNVDQRALDIALSDFLTEQEFPTRQLQEYQTLVRGFPFTPNQFTQEVTSVPSVPLSQQLLGLAGTGLQAASLGGFGPFGKKAGGQISGGLSSLEHHQDINDKRNVRAGIGELSETFASFRNNPGNTSPEAQRKMAEAHRAFMQSRSELDMPGIAAIQDEIKRAMSLPKLGDGPPVTISLLQPQPTQSTEPVGSLPRGSGDRPFAEMNEQRATFLDAGREELLKKIQDANSTVTIPLNDSIKQEQKQTASTNARTTGRKGIQDIQGGVRSSVKGTVVDEVDEVTDPAETKTGTSGVSILGPDLRGIEGNIDYQRKERRKAFKDQEELIVELGEMKRDNADQKITILEKINKRGQELVEKERISFDDLLNNRKDVLTNIYNQGLERIDNISDESQKRIAQDETNNLWGFIGSVLTAQASNPRGVLVGIAEAASKIYPEHAKRKHSLTKESRDLAREVESLYGEAESEYARQGLKTAELAHNESTRLNKEANKLEDDLVTGKLDIQTAAQEGAKLSEIEATRVRADAVAAESTTITSAISLATLKAKILADDYDKLVEQGKLDQKTADLYFDIAKNSSLESSQLSEANSLFAAAFGDDIITAGDGKTVIPIASEGSRPHKVYTDFMFVLARAKQAYMKGEAIKGKEIYDRSGKPIYLMPGNEITIADIWDQVLVRRPPKEKNRQ